MLNPLLVAGRKFDIRIFVVMCYTKRGDSFKGYFYQDGYVRTSWKKFSLKSVLGVGAGLGWVGGKSHG